METNIIYPPAPPSIWIAGSYISPTDIHREQYEKIMQGSMGLGNEESGKLMATYTLSKMAFGYKGVIQRRNGDRYFEHPKAVSLIGAVEIGDLSLLNAQARLLHDNSEDTILSIDYLRYLVGSEVASIVSLVTNPIKTGDPTKDARNKETHFLCISENRAAGEIKVPDRIHNLRTHEVRLILEGQLPQEILTQKILDNAERQIEETRNYIEPIARKLGGKYWELLEKDLLRMEYATRELCDSV